MHGRFPIHAVITVLEYCVEAVAIVAERLGLPGTNPKAVICARNKGRTRSCLQKAGVPTPRFGHALSYEDACKVACDVGYPLVMKPSHGVASFFASVIRDDIELREAFDKFDSERRLLDPSIQKILGEELLLEEYLTGRMLSVEIGNDDDGPSVIAICERKRYSQDETIETGTTMPTMLTPAENEAVLCHAKEVIEAFGLDRGIFHLEIMLTDHGPVLIEANPRLIGGTGPWLLRQAFDVDIFEPLIRVFTGEPLNMTPLHPSRYAVSRLIGSTRECVCPHTFDLGWLDDYRGTLVHWQLFMKPGDPVPRVRSNHDYIGVCVVTGTTALAAETVADEIVERLSKTLDIPLAQ